MRTRARAPSSRVLSAEGGAGHSPPIVGVSVRLCVLRCVSRALPPRGVTPASSCRDDLRRKSELDAASLMTSFDETRRGGEPTRVEARRAALSTAEETRRESRRLPRGLPRGLPCSRASTSSSQLDPFMLDGTRACAAPRAMSLPRAKRGASGAPCASASEPRSVRAAIGRTAEIAPGEARTTLYSFCGAIAICGCSCIETVSILSNDRPSSGATRFAACTSVRIFSLLASFGRSPMRDAGRRVDIGRWSVDAIGSVGEIIAKPRTECGFDMGWRGVLWYRLY